ncbi:MAG: DUF2199 domain-containing protein [Novosphingobium sp.]|uniref:DUF2199 domain-containing protein n=1 Tax=Novosphingobium sp. TaxID=1874826 RepID=UPI003C7B7FE9
MSWFRRTRKPSAAEIVNGAESICTNCTETHHGMFDLAAIAPDPWPGKQTYAPNSELSLDGDFLSEDFCVLEGRNFLVRCVLEIPVVGMEQLFGLGCWGTLSRANFEDYIARFDDADYAGVGPWTSWLCNDLLGLVGTKPIGCWMFLQLDRQRPTLRVQEEGQALAQLQKSGLEPEQVIEIYRNFGHSVG